MPTAAPGQTTAPHRQGARAALALAAVLLLHAPALAACGDHVSLGGDRERPARCAPGVDCPLEPAAPVPCPGCFRGRPGVPLTPTATPPPGDDIALPELPPIPHPQAGGPVPPLWASPGRHRQRPPVPPPRPRGRFTV